LLGELVPRQGLLQPLLGETRIGVHERRIELAEDRVILHDRVHLLRQAEAVIFGVIDALGCGPAPIVIGGVKTLDLTRVYREGHMTEVRRSSR
jgi:hypothetical protein